MGSPEHGSCSSSSRTWCMAGWAPRSLRGWPKRCRTCGSNDWERPGERSPLRPRNTTVCFHQRRRCVTPYFRSEAQMYRTRVLETRLQALCDSGELAADLHMTTGQEATAAGVCAVLEPKDMVLCHHRMIGWALACGVPLEMLVKELMGGLMGEMHFRAPEYGFAHSFQLVGTVVPVAAGVAWALKQKGAGGIAVAVFGDAATANGQWHEGVNIAAVMGLPLLLVCENNRLAGNVTEEHYMPVERAAQRAFAYGIESLSINGNILDTVIESSKEAIEYVRSESKPFLLECMTTRLGKHKQGMGDLRTKDEMAALRLRDP